MAVYAVVEVEIMNIDGMAPYMVAVSDTIAEYGGKFLVRGGATEVVEGGLGEYPLKVIVEFPSKEVAVGWYESAGYQAILPYRTANSKCNFIWVDGV